jgi:hypothetical protein
MADFKAALKEGFAAAEKAETARLEVEEVLGKLKQEILESSQGKLSIEIRQLELPLSPLQQIMASATIGILAPSPRPEPIRYWAVVATNPTIANKAPIRELARWKQSVDGYPCTIAWNKQELLYNDRVALEEGLADLLRDPSVGEQLRSLMELKPS